MEAVIFNADFEWQLFQAKQNFKSTRKTQEFEYLISWIQPELTIYTTLNYPKDYQRWYFKFMHRSFSFTSESNKILPWSGNYNQIQLKRKLQDKSKTLSFAAKYALGPKDFSLLNSIDAVEPGFLYKFPKSLSGMGHYEFKDKKQISALLKSGEILTKERKLDRLKDFSTLWYNDQIIFYYQNIVNDSYQYRGTIIDENLAFLTADQLQKFQEKLLLIQGWVDGLKGYFSIDSFIYNDEGQDKIYYLSEINCRKTMGYIAYQLKKSLFPESKLTKFIFGNYKISVKDYEKLWEASCGNVIALSPEGRRFKAFLIAGPNLKEISKMEKLLF